MLVMVNTAFPKRHSGITYGHTKSADLILADASHDIMEETDGFGLPVRTCSPSLSPLPYPFASCSTMMAIGPALFGLYCAGG